MEYTRSKDMKRDETIVVADIYSNGGDYAVEVEALKDSEDGEVVKVEAYGAYTTYAQWMEPGEGYLDETEGYWEIDGGSLGD